MVYFAQATLRFDGSCNPNPGEGGSGYEIFESNESTIVEGQFYVGNSCTNNVAEYFGLIAGLKRLRDSPHEIGHLDIEGDSELVINQLKRIYDVKSRRLKPLLRQARALIKKSRGKDFQSCSYSHIDRRYNENADRLANAARYEKQDWSEDKY